MEMVSSSNSIVINECDESMCRMKNEIQKDSFPFCIRYLLLDKSDGKGREHSFE